MQFQAKRAVVEGLEDLVPLMDRLKRTWTSLCNIEDEDAAIPSLIDLFPTIAVLGSPESGKSSVLESIMQIDFLPTAAGTRTLSPLVLELKRTDTVQPYAQLIGSNDMHTNLADVRSHIESISLNNTSSAPIHIRICSKRVANMTIVDLPALTEVFDDGQTKNMSGNILRLARTFIEKSNCIILIVSPATNVLVNSEAIKISQEFDPDGKRTFGVLTKVDLVDNFTKVLGETSSSFKFPWICVCNRSQQDVQNKVDLATTVLRERTFFANKPDHSSSTGSEILTQRISKVMESLLTRAIKDLENRINPVGTRFIGDESSSTVPWTGLPKSLLGAVRSQTSKRDCGFQAGMVVTETLHIIDGASKDPPEDFMYKLSLPDLSKSYRTKYPLDAAKREVDGSFGGSLGNTMELIKDIGVYGIHVTTGTQSKDRIKIKDFRRIVSINILVVLDALDQGKPLAASFRISANYYDMEPGEVYRFDPDRNAKNSSGTNIGHSVMIVGYLLDELLKVFTLLDSEASREQKRKAVLKANLVLYYQNSYGTEWGICGGFGLIECTSISRYFLPKL